jgi:hypothetical protein
MSYLDQEIDSMVDRVKHDEVQGRISHDLIFRYNSVNVVIGQRGSGKTHFVLREILKLLAHPKANYTSFFYSSNKISTDATVEKFKQLFQGTPLEIQEITHDDTAEMVDRIAEAKNEYRTLLGRYSPDRDDTNSDDTNSDDTNRVMERIQRSKRVYSAQERPGIILRNCPRGVHQSDYLDTLLSLNVLDLSRDIPHTIIFIDDCIDLLNKRGALFKKLFENRQSRITYFLGLQDVQGIPPSMKSNMDLLILFGGFSKQKFNILFYQIPMDCPTKDAYEEYRELNKTDALIISFEASGIKKFVSPGIRECYP